nr:hypothetical protein [Candidatus Woesearchaeota archaeon]
MTNQLWIEKINNIKNKSKIEKQDLANVHPNYLLRLRMPRKGLYLICLERLAECKTSKAGIISFPDAISKLASSFSIQKKQVWDVLLFLKDLGFINIHYGHGIKINYRIKNES